MSIVKQISFFLLRRKTSSVKTVIAFCPQKKTLPLKAMTALFYYCTNGKLNCLHVKQRFRRYRSLLHYMSGCLQLVHIIQQAVHLSYCLIFWEKETLPQPFTRNNTDSGQLFTFDFSLKRWRKEKERLWLKKCGRRLRWTNTSVNVKSAGFILKQPSILIVICAAHFIMLVLDPDWWECRDALD